MKPIRSFAIRLMPLLLASAAVPAAAATYEVAGTVVDSRTHSAIAHMQMSLAPTNARARKLEMVTGKDGRFTFSVNQSGKYELKANKPGYPPQGYKQPTFLNFESAIAVRDGQDTNHLMFEAVRAGSITGRIEDENADPVANAQVWVFQQDIFGGEKRVALRGSTRTNSSGEFRFQGLPQGDYYLFAQGHPWFADALTGIEAVQRFQRERPKPAIFNGNGQDAPDVEPGFVAPQPPPYLPDPAQVGHAFSPAFYPRGQSEAEAELIHLDAGSTTRVTFVLSTVKGVSIRGVLETPGEDRGRMFLYKVVFGVRAQIAEAGQREKRIFEFANIAPGRYEVSAASQTSSGPSSWSLRREIEVSSADTEVAFKTESMGGFTGKVLFDGAPPRSVLVSLTRDGVLAAREEVRSGGTFDFKRLIPGHYEITSSTTGYIASYLLGPDRAILPLVFDLPPGETTHRDLTMTPAAAAIDGLAESGGVPQVGAFAILMPKDPSKKWVYRADQSDSDGTFGLSTIPAGDYYLIALSQGHDIAYRDPKVRSALETSAKAIHLDENQQIHLKIDVTATQSLKLP